MSNYACNDFLNGFAIFGWICIFVWFPWLIALAIGGVVIWLAFKLLAWSCKAFILLWRFTIHMLDKMVRYFYKEFRKLFS